MTEHGGARPITRSDDARLAPNHVLDVAPRHPGDWMPQAVRPGPSRKHLHGATGAYLVQSQYEGASSHEGRH